MSEENKLSEIGTSNHKTRIIRLYNVNLELEVDESDDNEAICQNIEDFIMDNMNSRTGAIFLSKLNKIVHQCSIDTKFVSERIIDEYGEEVI